MLTLAQDVNDISKTLTAFNHLSPANWRKLVGNKPIYFVHEKRGNKHLFCISKACGVKDFQFTTYLAERKNLNGGDVQHRISYLTDTEWLPLNKVKADVRSEFNKWIHAFFRKYDVSNAFIISLNGAINKQRMATKRQLTEAELKRRLKEQELIGQIGEEIAYNEELQRLSKSFSDPKDYVELLSSKQVNAGFDIKSFDIKANRPIYIEVKASLTEGNTVFHLSNNEVETLRALGKQAYIHLVHVTDVEKRAGKVVKRIPDPIPELNLTAETYVAKLKG